MKKTPAFKGWLSCSLGCLCIILTLPLNAQHCHVNEYIKTHGVNISPLPASAATAKETGGIAYIPLQFHIIYGSGADGANWFQSDTTLVDQHIDTVNTKFLAAGIQFCKAGIDLIYNDTFCNIDYFTLYSRFRADYPDTTVIHVFVPAGFGTSGMTLGYSFHAATDKYHYAGAGNAIAMVSWLKPTSGAQKYVMTHELGHYFGLFHPNNYTYPTDEYVDRSNCDTTGDYCCGTPAEYGAFYADTNCNVLRFLSRPDAHGDTLMPDPHNIMSDNAWSMNCRAYFTRDQIDRISYYHKHYLHYLHCAGTVSVPGIITEHADVQLSPDPAASMQMIRITGAAAEPVVITLHDLTGRQIREVYRAAPAPDRVEISSDVSDLAAGIYLYRIRIGGTVVVRENNTVVKACLL